jgi:hypothetical protein
MAETDPNDAPRPPAAEPQPPAPERLSPTARTTPLGIYDKASTDTITAIEIIAILLSAIWLLGAAFFFLVLRGESDPQSSDASLRFLMTALAVFMPVAMIWVAATAAKASKVMREESQRLQTAIDSIRQAYLSQQQGNNSRAEPSVNRKLDEIAAATRKTETALATFHSRREGSSRPLPQAAPPMQDDQPALALGTQAIDMAPQLSNEDFIRALNFPETADDKVGFASLRRALKDRSTSQLVQAAQDVLTLMSQDGIYMDDLSPDRARPEIWRQFAQGARGRAIAPLGGIRDRSSLALTNARMKQDPIFRDAAHHFLRRFDKTFAAFEINATDTDISAMADTRTSRAFMLLGRCAGTFD